MRPGSYMNDLSEWLTEYMIHWLTLNLDLWSSRGESHDSRWIRPFFAVLTKAWPTDQQTDRPTDTPSYRDARAHLKMWIIFFILACNKQSTTLYNCNSDAIESTLNNSQFLQNWLHSASVAPSEFRKIDLNSWGPGASFWFMRSRKLPVTCFLL